MKNEINILGSWGNSIFIKSKLHYITSKILPKTLIDTNYIAYGNGRSYGDCALNKNSINTKKLNNIISFNSDTGVLTCESGVLLSTILEKIILQKWFLPVTPGTKEISIGGAIATDVHGKNHHVAGCFSEHILNLKLLLPSNKVIVCSKNENSELFKATCGGMGLTGIILELELQLIPINSNFINQKAISANNLQEMFNAFESYKKTTYTVAWINGFSTKTNIGKGILFAGEHSNDGDFKIPLKKKLAIPTFFPSFILNSLSMRVYNAYFFITNKRKEQRVSIDSFFYPLDSVKNWNRIYGKKGFIQYQIVLPKEKSYSGILKLLEKINNSKFNSFLTVLKLFGKENENYLSFPFEGYTIAMDFKISPGLIDFLTQLDSVVSTFKGRTYLAKDVRMSKVFFKKGYPKINKFKEIRKSYKLEKINSLQSKRLGL